MTMGGLFLLLLRCSRTKLIGDIGGFLLRLPSADGWANSGGGGGPGGGVVVVGKRFESLDPRVWYFARKVHNQTKSMFEWMKSHMIKNIQNDSKWSDGDQRCLT